MNTVQNNLKLPMFVQIFGWILVFVGFSIAILGFVSPGHVVTGFEAKTPAHSVVVQLFAARNVAMASALLIGLVWKLPRVLAVVFFMRFITEFLDLSINLYNGTTLFETKSAILTSPITVVSVFILFFFVPELWSSWKCWKLANEEQR